jgi:hypothetical protein
MAEKEKKVIIDSDWKAQAQAEKEKAQAEIEAEKQTTPELPKGDFPSLVSMLATQAYYAMGLIGNPNDPKKPELNLEMARYIIDVLSTLEEKTKGNLTEEETTFFQSTLNQLRMIFVKISES